MDAATVRGKKKPAAVCARGPTTTAGTAEIVVTWVLVHQEVRPHPGLRHSGVSVRLSLRGGSAIAESYEATDMRGQRRGRGMSRSMLK